MMNWYKLLKLAFSRTKSQKLTMSLSRQIFDFVKNNYGKEDGITLRVGDQCNLYLRLIFAPDETLAGKNFRVEAFCSYSKNKLIPPVIQFYISFNKNFSALNFYRLYYDLYNAVRHELRHYWQYLYPSEGDNNENNELVYNEDQLENYQILRDYILSQGEIEPYVSGLVFTSQKQKISLSRALDANLNELFFENNDIYKNNVLSSSIGNETERIMANIKNETISMARQLYPYARPI